MPATKKSAAYEKGLREGRADKNKPSIEIEINPEGEEEEEMGTEEMDAIKPHSRKRSSKNAKHTTPAADGYGLKQPMDAECGCEGKGRKGKASCDGNCGGYAKKMDALSPQEYLAACDLGIQHRSRAYIRARLDAAERLDLKCGAGSISEGEKCTKGTAQKAQAPQGKSGRVRGALENAAIIAGGAGTAFSYGQVAVNALRGNFAGASKALQREGAFASLAGAGIAAKGARTKNKVLQQEGLKTIGAGATAIGAGHLLGGGYTKGLSVPKPSTAGLKRGVSNLVGRAAAAKSNVTYRTAKSRFERMYSRPGRRDSVYAAGFSPEPNQLAI